MCQWEKCQGLHCPDEQTPDCKGEADLMEHFNIHFRLEFRGLQQGNEARVIREGEEQGEGGR